MDGRWFNGHYCMECYKSPVIFNSCLELTVVSYSQLCIPKWIHTHYAMQEYLNFRASWYPTSSYIPFKLLFWNFRNIHMCLMHPIIQRAHANVLLYTLNFSGRFTLSRSCTYAKLHHLTQFSPLAHKKIAAPILSRTVKTWRWMQHIVGRDFTSCYICYTNSIGMNM